MGKTLTDQQLKHFREEGWLAPFRAMPAEEARRCFERIERFEKDYGREANSVLRLKSHIVLPWIAELARRPEILGVVEDLIGPDIRLFSSTVFAKDGQNDTFVSWHQDSAYFGLSPHDLVTAWVAFTESTVANGCLRVLPRSHIGENRVHEETFAKKNLLGRGQTIHGIDEAEAVSMPLEAGQFSLHHEKMAHSSQVNTTPHRRIGFAFFYMPAHVKSVHGRRSSYLVRGVDTHGHWDDDVIPDREMDPAAVAILDKVRANYRDGKTVKQAAVAT